MVVAGIVGLLAPPRIGIYAVLFLTGAIFPVALLLAKITKQQVIQPGNSFASLMGAAVLMVNLLWALHLVLLARLPSVVPLSVASSLGIHWIVFGWIIRSRIGVIHAVTRTILCTTAFLLFPQHTTGAVSFAVVLCYGVTLVQLRAVRGLEKSPAI